MNYQSSTITSDLDKANAFNKFFNSVFNSTSTDVSLNCLNFPNKSLCSISISESDTFLALSSLDPSKSMGGDGIPPIVLQRCATALTEPVYYLFTQCLLQSYLPKESNCSSALCNCSHRTCLLPIYTMFTSILSSKGMEISLHHSYTKIKRYFLCHPISTYLSSQLSL